MSYLKIVELIDFIDILKIEHWQTPTELVTALEALSANIGSY